MKTDFYTKSVLTVIALCLAWMCLNGATPIVWAQAQRPRPAAVVLVDEQGVPIFGPEGLRVTTGDEPLPVTVVDPVPVVLGGIQRSMVWDPLEVHVLREPPTLAPIP